MVVQYLILDDSPLIHFGVLYQIDLQKQHYGIVDQKDTALRLDQMGHDVAVLLQS